MIGQLHADKAQEKSSTKPTLYLDMMSRKFVSSPPSSPLTKGADREKFPTVVTPLFGEARNGGDK